MTSASDDDKLLRAKRSVFRLLTYRARSRQEIRTHLSRKKFSKTVTSQTIKYFDALELLDDRKFAEEWIASQLLKTYGFRRIIAQLKQKGIGEKIIQREIAAARRACNEPKTVLALAQKRMSRYKTIEPAKAKMRIYRYLIYRGFTPSVVADVLKKL